MNESKEISKTAMTVILSSIIIGILYMIIVFVLGMFPSDSPQSRIAIRMIEIPGYTLILLCCLLIVVAMVHTVFKFLYILVKELFAIWKA